MRRIPISILILALWIPSASRGAQPYTPPIIEMTNVPVKGVNLAPIEDSRLGPVGYGTNASADVLREIADLGATWVSITPFGRMDDLDSTDILPDFEIPLAESIRRTRETIRQAKALGLRVALIPHLFVMSGRWRGEIDPGSERGWKAWFRSYERFLDPWVRLAAAEKVDLLSVGVEFKSSSEARADRWIRVIDRVRRTFHGPLTYSANWDEVEGVGFWSAVDVIGVNGFWPLARTPGDRYPVMRDEAGKVARSLDDLAARYAKPVLLTETGCKAAIDAALAPWEWPEHMDSLAYDGLYQAEFYEAVLDAMVGRPWFLGLFIWKVISDPYDWSQDPEFGFSPRHKPGWKVLQRWFGLAWSACEDPVTSRPECR